MGAHSQAQLDEADRDAVMPWWKQLCLVSLTLGAALTPFVLIITVSNLRRLPFDVAFTFVICATVIAGLFSLASLNRAFRRSSLEQKYWRLHSLFSWLN